MCKIQFLKSSVVVCQVPIKEKKKMSVTTEMEMCPSHKFRRQEIPTYFYGLIFYLTEFRSER